VHAVPHHKTATVLASAVLVLSACTVATVSGHGSAVRGSPSTPAAGPTGGPGGTLAAQPAVTFPDCSRSLQLGALAFPPGRRQRLTFGCATISVPLDYAHPGGRTISVRLLRVHDRADVQRTGALLVNPGGPGGSGIDYTVEFAAAAPDRLLSHFDLIGFDPRGVGASTPIRCLSDHQKDVINAESPDIGTAAGFAEARRIAAEMASACSLRYGNALAQFNTVQTARDMDRIRQAAGDSRMNYLGFSYGTELGAQYAHLFPGTVRVAVLDGAVDPFTDFVASFTDDLKGFEAAFDQFAAYCRRTDPCRRLGDPRSAVYRVVAEADRSPIPSSAEGETRTATSSIVHTAVLSALYSRSYWPVLAQALLSAENGDSRLVFALADEYNRRTNGHYTNIADANTAITCNDSAPGPSDATIRATAASWAKRFPIFGRWDAPGLFQCQPWQPLRTVPPLPTARATADAVLVIGNLHDPATPYQGAKDLTRALGHAELLTWDGEGHTSFLQGSACVDTHVVNYLLAGTLPPPGTTCPR
jgi:pimeloyl-ACP methyl ester carboxylesterase